MSEYYLISQLPSLDGLGENTPLPITEERFFELCRDTLGEKEFGELEGIKLAPDLDGEKSSSSLIEQWNDGERNLRLALCKIRAEKLKKNFDMGNKILSSELLKVATEATEEESPLEAEKYLLNYRLKFLESLRPMDSFSLDFIYYYAIRLKLILRIRGFNESSGETAYRNIYNSIIGGDRLEAK